jgi:endonuclease/exonuclease/phosphatase family metal-dependent hydrolase
MRCPTLRSRRAGALALAVLAAGCGTASNFLDPQGPRYAGEYAGSLPAAGDVHVVTFNIAHAKRIPQAVAILKRYASLRAPDVLALQEMDEAGSEAIAQALALNYVYYPASRGPGEWRDMGEAVLSPWPIEDSWKVKLPHLTRGIHRSRAAVAARIRIGGRRLVAYSVHFGSPWGMGPGSRRDQAEAVLADAHGRPEPVVIAGDFNSKGVSHVFESAGFCWPTRDIGHTAGPFSFDQVVARNLAPVGDPPAGVVHEAKQASDHRPVWATFAFAP